MGGILAKCVSDAEILRFFTDPKSYSPEPDPSKPKPKKPKNDSWACDQFHGLKTILGQDRKVSYSGQQASQWLQSHKAATGVNTNLSAKMIRSSYEDGIQSVKGQSNAPFAYWLAHRILSDKIIDPGQKVKYLEKLIAQHSVSLDQILASAPKPAIQGVLKLLGHEGSPSLAQLIGRHAGSETQAKIIEIIARGVNAEKRSGVLQAMMDEVKDAKSFNHLVSHLKGKAWEFFKTEALLDPKLGKRLAAELSPEESAKRFLTDDNFRHLAVKQIKSKADFEKYLKFYAQTLGMGQNNLGFFMAAAIKSMDPILFNASLNHIFADFKLIYSLGVGLLGDTDLQEQVFGVLSPTELKNLSSVLLNLEDHQPSVLDFMTDSRRILTEDNFHQYGLKTTQQSRLAKAALEHLAKSVGGKKFHQLFGSFKGKSYGQKRWASVIARSPQLQKFVGQTGSAPETGAMMDAILNLKIKKQELGGALQAILKYTPTDKKNAVLFSSSARLAGFLETQLHLGRRDFEKSVLFAAMGARGVFEIRKALIFLAMSAKNNPQVVNAEHVGVVVNQSRSMKNSQSLNTKIGAQIGTDGLPINASISAEMARGWGQEQVKGSGQTVDLDKKQRHGRSQKRHKKIWKVILPLDNSVAAFARKRMEIDPAFAKAYHQLFDLHKKDTLRKSFNR